MTKQLIIREYRNAIASALRETPAGPVVLGANTIKNIIAFAKSKDAFDRYVSYGVKDQKALLQPFSSLSVGVWAARHDLSRVCLSAEAHALLVAEAASCRKELYAFPVFEAPAPEPVVDPRAAIDTEVNAILEKGKNHGSYDKWQVKTDSATITYHTTAFGAPAPAMVVEARDLMVTDKTPRSLREMEGTEPISMKRGDVTVDLKTASNIRSEADFQFFIDAVKEKNLKFIECIDEKFENEREAPVLQWVRRQELLQNLRSKAQEVKVAFRGTPSERSNLIGAMETLIKITEGLGNSNRKIAVRHGGNDNYWPYWRNYVNILVDQHKSLMARADACDVPAEKAELLAKAESYAQMIISVRREKTVNSYDRSINERDFEESTGMAVVFLNTADKTDVTGARVSMAKTSTVSAPVYELLSILIDGKKVNVYRDGDKLFFDAPKMDNDGNELTEEQVKLVTSRLLTSSDIKSSIGLRPTDKPIAKFSFDWDSNLRINVALIDIGWWGHCHNEAPANASAIDVRRNVHLLTLDPSIAPGVALETAGREQAWSAVGSLLEIATDGFVNAANPRFAVNGIEETAFEGERNNGRGFMQLKLANGQTKTLSGVVSSLYQPYSTDAADEEPKSYESNTENEWGSSYSDPFKQFQPMRRVKNADGHFVLEPNPLNTGARYQEKDLQGLKVNNTHFSIDVEYDGMSATGEPEAVRDTRTIDPKGKLPSAENTEGLDPLEVKGYVLIEMEADFDDKTALEHWYSARDKAYVSRDVKWEGTERKIVSESAPQPVNDISLIQETGYDSVIELHNFFKDRLVKSHTNDITATKAVWNYTKTGIQMDLVDVNRATDKEGKPVTYLTYKVPMSTMGGDIEMDYTIMLDRMGNEVAEYADKAMVDFAFEWVRKVCAMATDITNGFSRTTAVSKYALENGSAVDSRIYREGSGAPVTKEAVVTAMIAGLTRTVFLASCDDAIGADTGDTYAIARLNGEVITVTKAEFDKLVKLHEQMYNLTHPEAVVPVHRDVTPAVRGRAAEPETMTA